MIHLIQPIEISTAPLAAYCCTQHGGRATIGINTSITTAFPLPADVSNPASPWEFDVFSFTVSEVSFGVGCGDEVTLYIETSGEPTDPGYPAYDTLVTVYVNGGLDSNNPFDNGSPNGNIVISLSDVACGNLITLVVSGTAESYATITIDSIT